MNERYEKFARLMKALSDLNRLMIVELLSAGELCTCCILEQFQIKQSTLSHHMKILCECGLVNGRKEGKLRYYSLNQSTISMYQTFFSSITSNTEFVPDLTARQIHSQCNHGSKVG